MGILHNDWILTYVMAAFNKGKRREVGNYGPIILTYIGCKVLVSILNNISIGFLGSSKKKTLNDC